MVQERNAGVEAEIEISPGRVLQRFDAAHSRRLAADWMRVYAHDAQGLKLKAYLWHSFAAGHYPSVCKHQAERQYQEQWQQHQADGCGNLLLLANDRQGAWLIEGWVTSCNLADWYVFPPSLAWTMAFTHEDGLLGPYFARHPDYAALLEQERAQAARALRKREELERARRAGWV